MSPPSSPGRSASSSSLNVPIAFLSAWPHPVVADRAPRHASPPSAQRCEPVVTPDVSANPAFVPVADRHSPTGEAGKRPCKPHPFMALTEPGENRFATHLEYTRPGLAQQMTATLFVILFQWVRVRHIAVVSTRQGSLMRTVLPPSPWTLSWARTITSPTPSSTFTPPSERVNGCSFTCG